MFFPDKIKGYTEAYRVLKPGGRFIFSVWSDRISRKTGCAGMSVTDAIESVFPGDPAPILLAPTSYEDIMI